VLLSLQLDVGVGAFVGFGVVATGDLLGFDDETIKEVGAWETFGPFIAEGIAVALVIGALVGIGVSTTKIVGLADGDLVGSGVTGDATGLGFEPEQ